MQAHQSSRLGIIQIQIKINDFFGRHFQFFAKHLEQEIVFFESIVEHGQHGQHIFLFAKRVAFVHLTVEVDSQMRNREQRLLEMHRFLRGIERIFAT